MRWAQPLPCSPQIGIVVALYEMPAKLMDKHSY